MPALIERVRATVLTHKTADGARFARPVHGRQGLNTRRLRVRPIRSLPGDA